MSFYDQAIRAIREGGFSEPLSRRPDVTWGADYACWRFIKALVDQPTISSDHAVLLRQLVRWSGNQFFVSDISTNLLSRARRAGVDWEASGELRVRPFYPDWLGGDTVPREHGVDTPPILRLPDERIAAEPWLSALGEREPGLTTWQSQAQKEACWLAVTAPPGSSALISLPTGAGKSLCFQLLARAASGAIVVVVPTVALAIDQWQAARKIFGQFGNLEPRYFAADDTYLSPDDTVRAVKDGRCRLIFTSPEACVSGRLRRAMDEGAAAGWLQTLVIDEAHIVESWGSHFRVEFQMLASLRKRWREASGDRLRTLLLSATFTPECRIVLRNLFGRECEWREIECKRLRPEMTYFSASLTDETAQQAAVCEALWHLPRPLILYTTEPSEAEKYKELLNQEHDFQRIECFHGDTRPSQRRLLLTQWRDDEIDVMVATSAFGMGVDKMDVRAIVHACLPESIDRYYQEVGRGGRDGAAAVCVLLPETQDRAVAKGLSPTLLGDEKLTLRWRAMFEGARTLDSEPYVYDLPADARHIGLFGHHSYQENIRWNKRLLLLLLRANCIDLIDLIYERNSADAEPREWIRVRCHFPPTIDNLGPLVARQRADELEQANRRLDALTTYLDTDVSICRVLREQYGRETDRACGGCRRCRDWPHIAAVMPGLRFPIAPPGNPTLVTICGSPRLDNAKGRQELTRLIRVLVSDKFIRRFVCSHQDRKALLAIFAQAFNPFATYLYRLDAMQSTPAFDVHPDESVICLHLAALDPDMLSLRQGFQIFHLISNEVRVHDENGRLPLSAEGASHYPTVESWIDSLSAHVH